MKKFLLFLLALAALPLVWGVCAAVPALFALVPASSTDEIFSPEATGLIAGILLEIVFWLILPSPVRIYTFGHEATHALVGLLFGAKPSNLRVSVSGGSVSLTKSNVWITLAPYFLPFYTLLVAAAAAAVRLATSSLPLPCAWTFAVGFTWAFHVLWTFRALRQKQPDVHEYGRLFSWVLIFLFNALGIFIYLALSGGMPLRPALLALWDSIRLSYCRISDFSLIFFQKFFPAR